jgi:hypothetical protein
MDLHVIAVGEAVVEDDVPELRRRRDQNHGEDKAAGIRTLEGAQPIGQALDRARRRGGPTVDRPDREKRHAAIGRETEQSQAEKGPKRILCALGPHQMAVPFEHEPAGHENGRGGRRRGHDCRIEQEDERAAHGEANPMLSRERGG